MLFCSAAFSGKTFFKKKKENYIILYWIYFLFIYGSNEVSYKCLIFVFLHKHIVLKGQAIIYVYFYFFQK